MLSTSNLSAAQAETYYTKEDYYSKEEKAHPTKWVGKGAAALGLSGIVNQQDFSNLLAGKAPDGQSLTGRAVDPEKRRAGTDFTFSAPKSVSIAALVQQDKRVLAVHHQAVSKALSVLEERYAQTRVSTPTGRRKITTGNLAAAVFTQNPNPFSNIDYRAVGERIGKHIAEQLAAVESGNSDEHRTINPLEAPEQGFEELSAALESYLEPLARAIAGYCNQRDLLRCAGDLADAATAINLGLERLEQSAENRVELTAAVDRLNRALGEKVGQLVSVGEPNSVQSPEKPGALADISGEVTKGQQLSPPDHEERKAQRANLWKADFQSSTPDSLLPTPASQAPTQLSPRQRYQKMWARYSQDVEADTPVRLDYRVCRRAFEDGQSFKDVALMLAAGSPYVHWMAQTQGKEKSRVYVNQTARAACQKEKELNRPGRSGKASWSYDDAQLNKRFNQSVSKQFRI